MTLGVSALVLALGATRPPLALVILTEHVRIPTAAARVTSRPFERLVVVDLPKGAPAEKFAQKLKYASRLCPDVEARSGSLVFHCQTGKLRVDLTRSSGVSILDLTELEVPSWRPGDEGPPLTIFDTVAIGFGPCPGTSHEAKGECALKAGNLAEARREFEAAVKGGDSAFANLRLGDLALVDDEPELAVSRFRKARSDGAMSRLAETRLCVLDPKCLETPSESTVFDTTPLPPGLRADVTLKKLWLTSLRGGVATAAGQAVDELGRDGACARAPGFCHHLLEVALRMPPPAGTEALGVYLDTPGHLEGPDALSLARAAAAQARTTGAPLWAANFLASLTGRVPAKEEPAHLLEIARLYVEGGDRAHAEEIYRFARVHLSKAELSGPGWTSVASALRGPQKSEGSGAASRTSEDKDLAAAKTALDEAKLMTLRKGNAR